MPGGLRVLSNVPDVLLGFNPKERGRPNGTCFVGEMTDELSLTIPSGFRVRNVPQDLSMENRAAVLSVRWHQDGQSISVTRHLTSLLNAPNCSENESKPEEREGAKAIAEALRASYRDFISLERVH